MRLQFVTDAFLGIAYFLLKDIYTFTVVAFQCR